MATNTIYKGDTIDNFGRNLPVLYIDKIELFDIIPGTAEHLDVLDNIVGHGTDSRFSKIIIYLSLLVHTDDDFPVAQYIEEAYKDFHLNALLLCDKTLRDKLHSTRRSLKEVITQMIVPNSPDLPEDWLSSLDSTVYEGKTIKDFVTHTLLNDQMNTARANKYNFANQFKSMRMSDFDTIQSLSFANQYDENDNAILKSSNFTLSMITPRISDEKDMSIFIGISAAEPADLYQYNDILMAMSYGDLATEDIKVNNFIANRDKVGFFDEQDAFYAGMPMISTNGKYFKTDNFDAEQIKASLDNIQKEYSVTAQSDVELKTIMGNVDFIYSQYGSTPKYLVQLNAFRKNIKNQDVSTMAGRYYEEYRIIVFNANSALINDNAEVIKKITYGSKLRDHRPSQWLPALGPTYDPTLRSPDFIYNTILQTNLSKYVSARNDNDPSSINPLFTPEAPYNPEEMHNAYSTSIKAKLSRFTEAGTTNTTETAGGITAAGYFETGGNKKLGMDNLNAWLLPEKELMVNFAVTQFQWAYELFIDWAVEKDLRSSAISRIYLGGYGGGWEDGDSEVAQEYARMFGEDWEELPSSADDIAYFRTKYNYHAYLAAERFFGVHGNPEHCTLEFGYDTVDGPPDQHGNYDCTHSMFYTLNQDPESGEDIEGINSISEVDTRESKYKAYKCFKQVRAFINVVGLSVTEREDIQYRPALEGTTVDLGSELLTDESRFGIYKNVRSYESDSHDWTLRSPTWFASKIEELIRLDPFITGVVPGQPAGQGVDFIITAMQATLDLILNFWTGAEGSFFLNTLNNQELWNTLAAEEGLFVPFSTGLPSSELDLTAVDNYANKLADDVEQTLYLFLDTFVYGSEHARTYRLRWCPDITEDSGVFGGNVMDKNYGQANPYGGLWTYLTDTSSKRTADNDPYDASDSMRGPYFYLGGFGNKGGQIPITTTSQYFRINPGSLSSGYSDASAGSYNASFSATTPGRCAVNFAYALGDTLKSVWRRIWRPDLIDAVQDIVPLLHEYHGLNMSDGLHEKMAYIDIVTEKYGYFFFDMEKYIMKQSTISQYLNPKALEQFFDFGKDMLNNTIKIDEVKMHRWDAYAGYDGEFYAISPTGDDTQGTHVEMILNKNSNTTTGMVTEDISLTFNGYVERSQWSKPYPYIPEMDVVSWSELAVDAGELEITSMVGVADRLAGPPKSFNNWSYLIQRNYDFAGDNIVPNEYRIACFAFNYYVDDDTALRAPDAYQISVKVRDVSDRILTKILSFFNDIGDSYAAYVNLAEENCAYDIFNSQFNTFFMDKMEETYGDNMENSPWLKVATAIPILEDLIYGRYGGEMSVVYEAAQLISDAVNPWGGDLDSVRHYNDRLIFLKEQIEALAVDMQADHFTHDTRSHYTRNSSSEFKTFTLGNSATDFETNRDNAVIDRGIIDYSSARTNEFPVTPDDSVSQPPVE